MTATSDKKGVPAGTATDTNTPDVKTRQTFEPLPIAVFQPQLPKGSGHKTNYSTNLNHWLSDRLTDHKKVEKPLTLGRPAVFGSLCAIGTEDPDAKQQFLLLTDLSKLPKTNDDPIVSWCRVGEAVRDLRWLDVDHLLVATDKHVQICDIGSAVGTFAVKSVANCGSGGSGETLHTDSIRELAVSPYAKEMVASVGFDKKLCLSDLKSTKGIVCTRSYTLDDVIGSVRWHGYNGGSTVSVTVDSGTAMMYDVRAAHDKPVITINSGKQGLFTHDRYEMNHLLLGYGDGEMKHVDLRASSPYKSVIESTYDPFVDCIGSITYNAATDPRLNSFIVTGLTDFSIWRHDSAGSLSEATVFGHQSAGTNRIMNTTGFATSASYWDDHQVVVTNSEGYLQIFDYTFF